MDTQDFLEWANQVTPEFSAKKVYSQDDAKLTALKKKWKEEDAPLPTYVLGKDSFGRDIMTNKPSSSQQEKLSRIEKYNLAPGSLTEFEKGGLPEGATPSQIEAGRDEIASRNALDMLSKWKKTAQSRQQAEDNGWYFNQDTNKYSRTKPPTIKDTGTNAPASTVATTNTQTSEPAIPNPPIQIPETLPKYFPRTDVQQKPPTEEADRVRDVSGEKGWNFGTGLGKVPSPLDTLSPTARNIVEGFRKTKGAVSNIGRGIARTGARAVEQMNANTEQEVASSQAEAQAFKEAAGKVIGGVKKVASIANELKNYPEVERIIIAKAKQRQSLGENYDSAYENELQKLLSSQANR